MLQAVELASSARNFLMLMDTVILYADPASIMLAFSQKECPLDLSLFSPVHWTVALLLTAGGLFVRLYSHHTWGRYVLIFLLVWLTLNVMILPTYIHLTMALR